MAILVIPVLPCIGGGELGVDVPWICKMINLSLTMSCKIKQIIAILCSLCCVRVTRTSLPLMMMCRLLQYF